MTSDKLDLERRRWDLLLILKNEDANKINIGQYPSPNTLTFRAINHETGNLDTVGLELQKEAFNQFYTTLQSEFCSEEPPIIRLFANVPRRNLLRFAVYFGNKLLSSFWNSHRTTVICPTY